MARIAGVNLPNQKRLEVGLTYIFGIGQPTARKIAAELGLSPDTKVKDLTDEEVTKLRNYIDGNLQVEGDLRRERTNAIKRLSEIGAYRGLRRVKRLAKVDAVRSAGHRRLVCPQGHGARPEEGRGLRQGPRLGPRDGDPLPAGGRARDPRGQGRHPAGPQRRPPQEEAEG